MKRLLLGALAALTSLALPVRANAQDFDDLAPARRSRDYVESSQDLAVELRFGRYVPDADDGLSSTPYRDIFGTSNRYFGGFEINWQVLRIPLLGTLAPGFGIGYTKSSAKAPFELQPGRSGQDTSLEILPMYLVGVLRADVIARETVIPLVPYGKLGLGVALWQISLGEDTAEFEGDKGRGLSYGPQFQLGIMFLLDALDRDDARTADANLGLNHSYLFAEWYVSDLDGFGASDRLQVGTNTWMAGIALEF
ncbi:MAG TPA: MXAN_2562 family outer membrane beta-barrel protein [Polyangiaceae bacterium]